jgi:hypothetical protein
MAELMLREISRRRNVVGVFHGHPARRALASAASEAYPIALLPAISAPDCLLADLRVDLGSAALLAEYRRNTERFLERFPELSPAEREAPRLRQSAAVRRVTQAKAKDEPL